MLKSMNFDLRWLKTLSDDELSGYADEDAADKELKEVKELM